MAIRNDQIFELLQTMSADFTDMKVQVGKLVARVSSIEAIISKLPCATHGMDIALLKERVGTHKMNWSRVITIMLAVGQAILILWLAAKTAF